MVPKTRMKSAQFMVMLLLMASVTSGLFAQGQVLDMNYHQVLHKAERLQNSGNFQAAYQQWSTLYNENLNRDQRAQRAFNLAYLGLVLGHQEAPRAMRDFVRDFPNAPEVDRAYTMVGHYYFTKYQYANALAWFKEAKDFNDLSQQDQYEMAYAHFKLGQTTQAADLFSILVSSTEYGSRSLYYLAFIDYQNKNWAQALTKLGRINVADRDELEAWGLMADLAFRTKDYTQAAAWGIRALDALQISGDKRNINKSSLYGIVGRAYAQLDAYSLAINYLEKTVDVPSRGLVREERVENQFYLGQCYAAMGQNKKAIEVLSPIKDAGRIAQDVAYIMAGAYLALDQKTEALNAYKKACDPQIERPFSAQAHYQYAKLTYDLRLSYTSVPKVLASFFQRYPSHPKSAEVEQWWLEVLLESENYQQVITYLQDKSLLSANQLGNKRQMALQRAYFLEGRQLYDRGQSALARISFEQSHKINSSNLIGAQAAFWTAVILSESAAYQKAIVIFDRLQTLGVFQQAPEWTMLPFEIGFAHMALTNYAKAQNNFLRYLTQKGSLTKEVEARLNLADCYFATRDYGLSLLEYDKVIAMGGMDRDYAEFQAALCLEFAQSLEAKARRLVAFLENYPNSVYRDQVCLSLGSAYVNLEKISEAETQFKALISNYEKSPLVASAYLNLGLISDNNEDFQQALDYFKNVVDLFPGSQEAISAVQSARNTFVALGRVQEYGQWVDQLDFISIDQVALDQASFESAKQAYTQGDDVLSIQRFEAYLNNYAQGRYRLEAHYFLSEIFWRQQNVAQALLHVDPVISSDENPSYVIPTLIRMARHYLSTDELDLAKSTLIRLLGQPLTTNQRTFALRNLMQLTSDGARWQEAIEYAGQLSNHLSPGGDAALLIQARLISAWSQFELGAFVSARQQYEGLDTLASGQYAAQLALARAYFAHLDQDYSGSNALIQKLAQNYANYGRYSARGLLLMAQNFEALSDEFQARFILENIRDNMQDFPQLQQEAIDRLAAMDRLKKDAQMSRKDSVNTSLNEVKPLDSQGPNTNNEDEQ